MKTPVYHPNKETLFNNQFTFKNYVNTLAKQNGSLLIVGDIHNVRAGKGLSKTKVYIDVYLKGQWGVTLTVDMSTYKLLNEKTIGKYPAQQAKEMINEAISFFYNFILEGFAEIDGTNERKRQQEQAEKAKREYIDSLQSEVYFDFLYNENDVLTLTPEQYYNDFITKHNVTDEETKEILSHYIKRKYKRAMKNKTDQQTNETVTQETNVQEVAQQTSEASYIVGNRAFNTYEDALQYCHDCDFDADTMIEKVENISPSHNDQEVFYLYNNTFNTYNEAFNYACDNDIPVHMIISNNHPFMTNERLQELEKLYTFARHSMTYEQVKEYIDYLQTIPETLDQQERLYKLKSILQRLENRQRRLQEKEAEQKRMSREIDRIINDLYALGMTKKEYSTHVTYYLNGKDIYTWFSGITTEKMYNELLQVYNQYVKYNNVNAV
jgi:hypothetical protein